MANIHENTFFEYQWELFMGMFMTSAKINTLLNLCGIRKKKLQCVLLFHFRWFNCSIVCAGESSRRRYSMRSFREFQLK